MTNNYCKISSLLSSNIIKYRPNVLRFASNKAKLTATLDSDVFEQFVNGLKHRKHEGRRRIPCVSLPPRLESAAIQLINKHNCSQFKEDVERMFYRTHFHQLPPEESDVKEKIKQISHEMSFKEKFDFNSLSDLDRDLALKERQNKIMSKIKQQVYNWKEIEYDDYSSAVYMTARLPANYAALLSIFNGIKKDDPDFTPSTLFDFGSGVGTTIWAANELWPKSFDEYFCVDISADMNDLSRLLLQGGKENKKMIYEPVFHRQYLPVSHNIKYDLVVSAFSLLELPNVRNRIHAIESLWHKTQDMIVIVEHGSRAGFAAVLEARNLILEMAGHKVTANFKPKFSDNKISTLHETTDATVVSPCPHELTCPRLSARGLCHFEVKYNPLNYGQQMSTTLKERFSYVVIRKGNQQSETKSWPRIVQPVLTGHHRAICRMCCSDGQIKEIIFSKAKHEKQAYLCSRISRWGDKFPGNIHEMNTNNISNVEKYDEKYDEENDEKYDEENDEKYEDNDGEEKT